ncbi:hypothetical protein SAMN02799630_04413 [Paenibacillus sp. UNCCL117]|uniref:hypothetical protein n=1 Tax=unclassified Paenibacillus TaxID=185978 RepID=UPI00087F3F63|nr:MULTISPECIES: hypothetical protein [unclassified Paenibacillus]SDE01953.1 hypothetical protein SAMN04488602_11722 [Paenibacillus sp. cl123]SFW57112.1 hypothetical protein SAMN02799630_04413 [Paenibacillus sp. UNCCL117]
MSLTLSYRNWSFDADLQIVHADVLLEIGGEAVVDEPLCVDVGLPALLLSAAEDVRPDRWAGVDAWEKVPFFICGCGDPECRGFSFIATHRKDMSLIELQEVEERQDAPPRPLAEYEVDREEYARQVKEIGETFLSFVEPLDYRPLYGDTVATVRRLLAKLADMYPGLGEAAERSRRV